MPKRNPNAPPHKTSAWQRIRREKLAAKVLECFICGGFVDRELRHPNEYSPELHCIVPLARGGNPFDWNNTAIVHRVCNRRQQDRLPGESYAAAMVAIPGRPVPAGNWSSRSEIAVQWIENLEP